MGAQKYKFATLIAPFCPFVNVAAPVPTTW